MAMSAGLPSLPPYPPTPALEVVLHRVSDSFPPFCRAPAPVQVADSARLGLAIQALPDYQRQNERVSSLSYPRVCPVSPLPPLPPLPPPIPPLPRPCSVPSKVVLPHPTSPPTFPPVATVRGTHWDGREVLPGNRAAPAARNCPTRTGPRADARGDTPSGADGRRRGWESAGQRRPIAWDDERRRRN